MHGLLFFYVVIVVIHFIGSKAYGEFEFIIGLIKVFIVGFIIMGIVVDTGGGPTGEFIGGRYWRPGPTKNGFKGSVQFSSLQHFHMVSLGLLLYLLLNNQTHARPFNCMQTYLLAYHCLVPWVSYHCWFACAIELGPFDE